VQKKKKKKKQEKRKKKTLILPVLEILIVLLFYPEPKHAIRLVARYIEDFLAMYDRAGEEVE
jgi:hypothetical protein